MLRKGLEALKIIALHGELSARELATAMQMPKSTAHRLMANLVDVRLLHVSRRPEGDVYALGDLIGELSGAAFMWRPLVQHARDHLVAVRDETGETTGIHMLYGDRRVLLDQVESRLPLRWVYAHHMAPMPLAAGATGKMFLSMLSPRALDEALAREIDERKGKEPKARALEELRARVDAIRAQGYSISSNEINPGITSIAVPVIEEQSERFPRAVISLAAPSARVDEATCLRYLERLKRAARMIREGLQKPG
ncbi:IclR family transcriptional regulator [Hydrogenophaga sp.]|uniref:IclR family transcriptional regulator n=1 Tax=Hydrogenophaga sp. TaxID=1904254 RepID=UPI00271E6028|nr:IclR family transcriptional regulator [Hydrogenophaga sp.]MDO9435190.1 IclR family transcriptional regulator [Hydrogenophaga sp.]